jgi:hypothetical protein
MFSAIGRPKPTLPAPVILALCLALLCSCATENSIYPKLPADVTMNKNAGRGDMLVVTLRLGDGEKLPFLVDSGSPWTLFDKSLESKLGKRLDTGIFWNFGARQNLGVYPAPKLYLGNVLLMTGTNVGTYDPRRLKSHGKVFFLGILGMDVLRHYCIQLDFTDATMRFLNDERADKTDWGQSFPLNDIGNGCFFISENLAGTKGSGSEIDTGCDFSGWLTPELFQQWTNHAQLPAPGETRSPDGVLGGETYRGLDLHGTDEKSALRNDVGVAFNGIGLRVLSQNLVTLDFPEQTMYLKRISEQALPDKDLQKTATVEGKSAMKFLMRLVAKNQLPGWRHNDKPASETVHFIFQIPDSITFDQVQKKSDPSIYHYEVSRPAKDHPWKLERAWRTDADGRVIQEYAVP